MVSPSGRVPEQALDLVFVDTEAYGDGTLDLGFFPGVSRFIGIFGVGFKSGGPQGVHKTGGRPQGVGRVLHPCGGLVALLAQLFCFGGFFWSIKNHRKFSARLDSV